MTLEEQVADLQARVAEVEALLWSRAIYLTNRDSASIAVLALGTRSAAASVPTGVAPTDIALNPTSSRLFVASGQAKSLVRINTLTATVLSTIPLGTVPGAIAVHPTGAQLYVASTDKALLSIIDTAVNAVTATVQVMPPAAGSPSLGPVELVASPKGDRAYVAYSSGRQVAAVDPSTHKVVQQWGFPNELGGMAVSAGGERIYVIDTKGGLIVIDPTTNATETFPVGESPSAVVLSPSGNHGYVTLRGESRVAVVDLKQKTTQATIGVGVEPTRLTINASGSLLCVVNSKSNDVSVISTKRNAEIFRLPVAPGPGRIAWGE